MSLASKAMLSISSILILTGGVITYYSIEKERELLTREFERRAKSLAKSLANSSVLPVLTNDRDSLESLLKGIKEEADTVYAIVEDEGGKIIARVPEEFEAPKWAAVRMTEPTILSIVTEQGDRISEAQSPVIVEVSRKGEEAGELFGITEASRGEEKRIAFVRIGLSHARMTKTMGRIRDSNIAITLGITFLTLIATFFLVKVAVDPISRLVDSTIKIANGDLDEPIEVTSGDEIGTLSKAMDSMRVRLKSLLEETVEKERTAQELLMARKVQLSLLPTKMPSFVSLELSGICIPAKEVGGDYYDYLETEEGGLGVAIGDVAGKGVPAALIMSMVKGSFRSNLDVVNKPKELLSRLNRVICEAEKKHMTTFFYTLIEPKNHSMIYSNAGHNFPYLLRNGNLAFLEVEGWPLGMMPDLNYQEGTISLERGDVMIFYTDGIVEAYNPHREFFGYDRFEKAILNTSGLPLDKMKESLLREVEAFCDNAPLMDDLSLLLIKIL